MKVSELIAELQKLDQDLPVVSRGLQSGFEDVSCTATVSIFEYPDCSWTRPKYSPFEVKNTRPVTAIFI